MSPAPNGAWLIAGNPDGAVSEYIETGPQAGDRAPISRLVVWPAGSVGGRGPLALIFGSGLPAGQDSSQSGCFRVQARGWVTVYWAPEAGASWLGFGVPRRCYFVLTPGLCP